MNLATEHASCDLGGQVVFRFEATSRDEPPPVRASLARALRSRIHLTLYMMSVINTYS